MTQPIVKGDIVATENGRVITNVKGFFTVSGVKKLLTEDHQAAEVGTTYSKLDQPTGPAANVADANGETVVVGDTVVNVNDPVGLVVGVVTGIVDVDGVKKALDSTGRLHSSEDICKLKDS